MPPTGSGRATHLWILALVVALALGLRLASVGRLLPEGREPDAFEVYEMQRVQGDPALVKHVVFKERYPWLVAWTLAALPATRAPSAIDAQQAEAQHLALAARPFLIVRTTVALLASLQVLLTYFLARRFLPPLVAALASFFVATSLLQLLFSVEARPHGAHAGLALLALIAALRMAEGFGWWRLVAAVATSAAAIASFQIGLSTLPPLFVACLLARGAGWKLRIPIALLAPLAAVALALPWYTNKPYIDATGIHLATAEAGGHTLFFQWMDFLGSWRGAELLFGHDPILALLGGAGIVFALWRARAVWRGSAESTRIALLVAGSFALPYLLVITIQGEVYERFLMPLLPFVACLAAASCAALWRASTRLGAAALPLRVVGVLLCCGVPLASAAQFVRLSRVPDTYEQAANWVRANVGAEQKIVCMPDISLPLLYAPDAVQEQMQDGAAACMPWVTYQATIPELPAGARTWNVRCFPARMSKPEFGPDLERMQIWLRENEVDYLVTESSRRWAHAPLIESLQAAASSMSTLVFRSRGSAPDSVEKGPAEYQAIEDHALRQARQRALGPELSIWKFERR